MGKVAWSLEGRIRGWHRLTFFTLVSVKSMEDGVFHRVGGRLISPTAGARILSVRVHRLDGHLYFAYECRSS